MPAGQTPQQRTRNVELAKELPSKKEVIKGEYEFDYKGKGEIAIKIVDVLGEEYFEVI